MADQAQSQQEREHILDQLYALALGGREGEHVLADLRAFCGYDDLIFDDENARRTDFMLGARSVYLYIKERIERAGSNTELPRNALED